MHSLLLPLRDGLSIAQLRRDPSSVGPLGGGSLGGGSLGGGSLGAGSLGGGSLGGGSLGGGSLGGGSLGGPSLGGGSVVRDQTRLAPPPDAWARYLEVALPPYLERVGSVEPPAMAAIRRQAPSEESAQRGRLLHMIARLGKVKGGGGGMEDMGWGLRNATRWVLELKGSVPRPPPRPSPPPLTPKVSRSSPHVSFLV